MRKRFHHNGQYICDYESTGDALKDIPIVNAILADRGIKSPTPTPEQAIFRQAVSFTTIAGDTFDKHINKRPPDGSAMARRWSNCG
jgi:hypothetical protein